MRPAASEREKFSGVGSWRRAANIPYVRVWAYMSENSSDVTSGRSTRLKPARRESRVASEDGLPERYLWTATWSIRAFAAISRASCTGDATVTGAAAPMRSTSDAKSGKLAESGRIPPSPVSAMRTDTSGSPLRQNTNSM